MDKETKKLYQKIVDYIADMICNEYDLNCRRKETSNFYTVTVYSTPNVYGSDTYLFRVECYYGNGDITLTLNRYRLDYDVSSCDINVDIRDPDMDQKILEFITSNMENVVGSKN